MDVSYQSFCSRKLGAICSMCVGIVLVPCTIAAIFWNESDAVASYATSDLVWKASTVPGCNPTMDENGKLVLAACDVSSPDLAPNLPPVMRPFLPSFRGSEITWDPEIYVWQQQSHRHCVKDNHGGQTCTTTYTCSASWQSSWIDSSSFRCPGSHSNFGHQMPGNMQSEGSTRAQEYSVSLRGSVPQGLALDADLQSQLPSQDLSSKLQGGSYPSRTYTRRGQPLEAANLALSGGYLTTAMGSPGIGDIRIKVSGRSAPQATVVAEQAWSNSRFILGPWPSQKFGIFGKRTKPLEKLLPGKLKADIFVQEWNSQISGRVWLWRGVCLIIMIVAFFMIFAPLSVTADLLRTLNYCTCCLGSLLDDAAQCVIHTVALSLALVTYLLAVAVSWIAARPALGIAMVLLGGGVLALCVVYLRRRKAGAPARQVQVMEVEGGGVPFMAAAPQQQTMQVTCPGGVFAGGAVMVRGPTGQQFQVTVPQGVVPGQTFMVQLPA